MDNIQYNLEKHFLNIPFLDEKHFVLSNKLNSFLQLFSLDTNDIIHNEKQKHLKEFINSTLSHFLEEESFLKEHKIPQMELVFHIQEHQTFITNLRKLLKVLEVNSNESITPQMLKSIQEWWLSHIEISDKDFLPFIKRPSS